MAHLSEVEKYRKVHVDEKKCEQQRGVNNGIMKTGKLFQFLWCNNGEDAYNIYFDLFYFHLTFTGNELLL